MKRYFFTGLICLLVSLNANAISDYHNHKNYSVSLKKLCYVNLYKGFTEFSNNLNSVNLTQFNEKIKKLGKYKGKDLDYTKAIPLADIMTTSDKLKLAIEQINKSLIKFNNVREACSAELDEYRLEN